MKKREGGEILGGRESRRRDVKIGRKEGRLR